MHAWYWREQCSSAGAVYLNGGLAARIGGCQLLFVVVIGGRLIDLVVQEAALNVLRVCAAVGRLILGLLRLALPAVRLLARVC